MQKTALFAAEIDFNVRMIQFSQNIRKDAETLLKYPEREGKEKKEIFCRKGSV